MNLRHEFDVPASPQATLELLLDAGRVVSCMPGATLVEVSDDGTWKTAMAVKLGPVGMDFLNDVRIVEDDSPAPRAPEGQPVSAVSLLWAAARGALARLIRFRPGLRQKGSL